MTDAIHPGLLDDDRWSLEDKEAARHISSVLQNTNNQQGAVQLQSLLAKVGVPSLIPTNIECSVFTHASRFHNARVDSVSQNAMRDWAALSADREWIQQQNLQGCVAPSQSIENSRRFVIDSILMCGRFRSI